MDAGEEIFLFLFGEQRRGRDLSTSGKAFTLESLAFARVKAIFYGVSSKVNLMDGFGFLQSVPLSLVVCSPLLPQPVARNTLRRSTPTAFGGE